MEVDDDELSMELERPLGCRVRRRTMDAILAPRDAIRDDSEQDPSRATEGCPERKQAGDGRALHPSGIPASVSRITSMC
jgi:hypothetical protein